LIKTNNRERRMTGKWRDCRSWYWNDWTERKLTPPPKWPILSRVGRKTLLTHSLCKLTGQFADKPTRGQSSRGLDNLRTGQLSDSEFLKIMELL